MARRSTHTTRPAASDVPPPPLGFSLGWLGTTVGYYLRTAQEAAFADFARRANGADAEPWRFAILALIEANSGTTQGDLAAALRRRTSTLTPALNELVRRGYVSRKRLKTDRRAYALSLTEHGRDAMLELMVSAVAHERELDRLVGPKTRAEFIRVLKRIAEGFSHKGATGEPS